MAPYGQWSAEARGHDLHLICEERTLRGFFRIDRALDRRDPRLPPGAHGLRGLLIDAAHQGRGLGRAAFEALPGYIRRCYPALSEIWLTVDADNTPAIRLYEATGWERAPLDPFPGRSGPEPVYRRVID